MSAVNATRVALVLGFALASSFACASREEPEEATPPPFPDERLDASWPDAPEEDGAISKPSKCSEDGFCYVPTSMPLAAVAASGANDAWMLPQTGSSILRWNGTSINPVYEYQGTTPPSITFAALWSVKKDDVWAIARANDNRLLLVRYASPLGGGAPEFRELRTPQTLATRATVAVWATPDGSSLWIASERNLLRVREDVSGAVLESFTAKTGAEDTTPYLWRGIWGFGPDDIWVAGKRCIDASCGTNQGDGAIGHYDGTNWSITTFDSTREILSLRGTLPGAERQLWFHCPVGATSSSAVVQTYLVPVTDDGRPGPPIYTHAMDGEPACSSKIGHVTTPTSGWFSDGLLLCRWTGTAFEAASTGLSNRPVVQAVSGIWAGNTDDVWMVGSAITREGVPPSGFAAWRTAASARAARDGEGGAP